MTRAWLHTWNNRPDGGRDCFLTREVPARRKIAPMRENKGATAATTQWQILVNGRWRRVWDRYTFADARYIGDGTDNRVALP